MAFVHVCKHSKILIARVQVRMGNFADVCVQREDPDLCATGEAIALKGASGAARWAGSCVCLICTRGGSASMFFSIPYLYAFVFLCLLPNKRFKRATFLEKVLRCGGGEVSVRCRRRAAPGRWVAALPVGCAGALRRAGGRTRIVRARCAIGSRRPARICDSSFPRLSHRNE